MDKFHTPKRALSAHTWEPHQTISIWNYEIPFLGLYFKSPLLCFTYRIASSVSNAPAEAGHTSHFALRYNALALEESRLRAAVQALLDVP